MTTFGLALTRLEPARLPHLLALVAGSMLIAANIFEHGFGYEPCQLCLYQRLTWWIVLGVSCFAAWLVKTRTTLAILMCVLAIVAIAAGAVIAGYHSGVEYQWWPGPSQCSGPLPLSDTLAAALETVAEGPAPPACDQAPWDLFGISMAGYNFLLSLAAALVAVALARRALKVA